MRQSARRAAALALAAGGVAAAYGCTERLDGGAACPILCPGQNVELRDTLIAAVVLDTTLASYPAIGDEPSLALAWRGDTLETRVIIRYDTLPTTFRPPNSPTDTPIELVEDAHVELRLRYPARRPDQTVTVDAYDVDTTVAEGGAADTTAATMLPLFRPDRFLGSLTFTPTGVQSDSIVRIPVDNAYLLAKILARARLRVGLLVRAAESAELSFETGLRQPQLSFRVSTDEAVPRRGTLPYSATPAERFIANSLGDFVIVARRRAPDTPAEVLTVGGVPGRRSYLRFDLPRGIVDSTSVVRATLLLTQYPNRLAAQGPDTISLYPQPVVASELVTDLQRAADLLGGSAAFRLDSLRTAPDDSGAVLLEVGGLIQVWRATQPERSSRALVLRLPTEGAGLDELYFFSTEAAATLKPRLRIVYVPRVGFGLP
ncbi:MAG: hypothetical protein ABR499_18205 [Gemmatimonadaceae bacterium]